MTKILVVDDQLAMRNMFKTILKRPDYQVDLCVDGEEAYKAAVVNKYDLVLTDLFMPKMNGIELTSKLRRLSSYKGIPILIVSTENSRGKRTEGKEAGATGWIVKPIKSEVLLPAVEKLLG